MAIEYLAINLHHIPYPNNVAPILKYNTANTDIPFRLEITPIKVSGVSNIRANAKVEEAVSSYPIQSNLAYPVFLL